MPAVVATPRRKIFRLNLVVALLFASAVLLFPHSGVAHAPQAGQAVRISQVFAGGGSSTAPYGCDFIELFNSSPEPVQLTGWSVQYYDSRWIVIKPGALTIPRSSYYLIAANPCEDNGRPSVPLPDFTYPPSLLPSSGQIALVMNEAAITGPSDPDLADFLGYGSAKGYEGSGPAPALSTTTSAQRKDGGCQDTDDNKADFGALPAVARNSASPQHVCPDTGPAVKSTTPADGATNVARDANLTVTFSEPVIVSGDWFRIECDLRADIAPASAAVSGGPTTFTIDPHSDLYGDDRCALTVSGQSVKDLDTADPPDAMATDHHVTFTTAPGACGDPAYPIHELQGSGSASPVIGKIRTVEAVVVGDFQGADRLGGYFLEEETADQDAASETSEGLFVSDGSAPLLDVAAGQRIRLTGRVAEVEAQTALTGLTAALDCGAGEGPAPITVSLPAPAEWWEQVEGMLVTFREALAVAGSDELASSGRLVLVSGERPYAFTQSEAPNAAGYAAFQDDLRRRSVRLDDGSDLSYPDPIIYPSPALSAANTARIGDRVASGLTGAVDGRNSVYRLQPTGALVFVSDNPRTAPPAHAGGNIRISFLNLDDYYTPNDGEYGPNGASSATELQRQLDKLVAALLQLDAGIIGVSRLENDGSGPESALADLVAGLNAATGGDPYAAIGNGSWGSGETTVGLLYQSARVTPVGGPAILATGSFAQDSGAPTHAAPMAQAFEDATWGERFTVIVNQWHDRGSCPTSGPDADQGDGQGCWNAARAASARDVSAWISSDPTHSRDPDFLILGELNAFRLEDPIQALGSDGYTDLIKQWAGEQATTYVWGGTAGYADYVLATASAAAQTVEAAVWTINADEPPALDYQTENKSAAQFDSLYAPDAYRSSNRNPVVVDLALLPDQSDLGGHYGTAWHTGQGTWRLGNAWGGADDGVTRGGGSWNDGRGEVTVSINGPAEEYACLHAWLDYSDGETQAGTTDAPNGTWDGNEKVIDGLALLPGENQVVTFALPGGVIDATATYNMRFRLVPAAGPTQHDCAPVETASADGGLAPTGRADGGEVEDWAFSSGPLAVRIASFAARVSGDRVQVTWETVDEIDAVGFDLHRGASQDGPWQRVNATLIPARLPGSTEGASYAFAYRGQEGAAWHRLEAVEVSGARSSYGPVLAEASEPNAVAVSEIGAWRATSAWTAISAACVAAAIVAALRRRCAGE
jgi:uncharacterized protein